MRPRISFQCATLWATLAAFAIPGCGDDGAADASFDSGLATTDEPVADDPLNDLGDVDDEPADSGSGSEDPSSEDPESEDPESGERADDELSDDDPAEGGTAAEFGDDAAMTRAALGFDSLDGGPDDGGVAARPPGHASDAGPAPDTGETPPDGSVSTDAGACVPLTAIGPRAASPQVDAGDSGAATTCFPSCIKELEVTCKATGACSANFDDPYFIPTCRANGVNQTSTFDFEDPLTIHTTVYASTAPCYSAEFSAPKEGLDSYVWRDGCGKPVATGEQTEELSPVVAVTCAESGERVFVDTSSSACDAYTDGAPSLFACEEDATCSID